MSVVTFPELPTAEIGEVMSHLIFQHGWNLTRMRGWRDEAGLLHIETDHEEAEVREALADYVPVAAPGTWKPPQTPLPTLVRQAVDFLQQRADAGDNVARATLVCLRHLNSRLE